MKALITILLLTSIAQAEERFECKSTLKQEFGFYKTDTSCGLDKFKRDVKQMIKDGFKTIKELSPAEVRRQTEIVWKSYECEVKS